MKKNALIALMTILVGLSSFGQTVTQLRDNYSGNTSWNSTTGTLTFSSTGTIYFSWKVGNGNNPETDQMQNFWDVPTEVKKIVINANVTVTGAFHTFGNCTIEGINRSTSMVYGTDEQQWADANNPGGQDLSEWYYAQFQNYGGTLTLRNFTSKNPYSYHVRGWGTKVNMYDCNILDDRGGSQNHSDGYCGGDGSVVENCYFETGDDVFKAYFDYTVNNCTVNMVENCVPIQLGWGNYSNGAHCTFNNLTIEGTSGRWSPSNTNGVIVGRSGTYEVTIDINGCTIQNPNAHMVMLWESGMTLKGSITDAKIDVKAYTQVAYNKGTDLLTICGNTNHTNSYNCSTNPVEYTWQADGNPIITHMRTADPAAHVWNDGKLWVYASHDQEDATDYSTMDGYHVFSTPDLVNWTDHGEVLHSRDVPWAQGGWMWAPDCAYKNGKYYFYFPTKDQNGYFKIGVATSTSPAGPFIPEPNYIAGTAGTDPCCFIDDDGTAYLYFGASKVARLKDNMIELDETPRTVDYGTTSSEFEGTWMHKRNGKYYYSWTNWSTADQGLYSMGDSPYGPFVYKGAVAPRGPGAQDHHSIVEFKNQWYYFYHVGTYDGGDGNERNVCAEYLYYNADGTMKKVIHTSEGISGVPNSESGIPGKIEAEAYSAMSGINTEATSDVGGGLNVGWIDNGDWMDYSVDVASAGEYEVAFRVASAVNNIKFDLKKGSTVLTTVDASSSGGWQTWKTVTQSVNLSAGVQTLRIAATGAGWNINWMEFTAIIPNQPPVANAGANQTVTDTDNSGSETVTLNGSTSSDSDGTITSYVWTEGGSQIATGATPNVTLSVGVHNLTLTVTDNDGATDTDGVTITVNAGITCTVPSPFISEDIGNTSVPGTGCESNGTFTLEGDGADIWGTADAFHYVYQSLSGDGEIIARVTSLENTNAWAKAGVMIRENNAAGSKHAMMIVTPGNGTAFQRRVTTNGTSLNTAAGDGLAAPVWVKMERSGSTLTGSKSTDGNTWTVVGSETISMTSDVLVGLCVTSHTTAAQATATFTNVSINNASIPDGAVAPEAGITVRLQNVETGLQLRPQSYADHAKLEGVTGDATSATEWTIEAINGYYRFVSVPANRRIRPTANEENSPAELGLTSWTGDWTQWTLTEVSTLTYRLINKQTGAYLKMESSSQGALCVHTTSASNATLWQLIGEGGTVPSCTPNAYDSEFLASANDANSGGMNTSTWCTDHIGQIDGGEWIAFNNICFGDGLASVTINATSGYDRPGSKAEIRLGSPTGQLIASIDVPNLNNWCGYTDFSANVSGVSGEHDVYVVFVGTTDIFDLHSVSFSQTLKSARPAENISQNVSDEIRVYPNPASEMVTVSGLQEGAILQVYNLQGQVVYTLIADGNQAEITNTEMLKGIYIVHINQHGNVTTKRIIFE